MAKITVDIVDNKKNSFYQVSCNADENLFNQEKSSNFEFTISRELIQTDLDTEKEKSDLLTVLVQQSILNEIFFKSEKKTIQYEFKEGVLIPINIIPESEYRIPRIVLKKRKNVDE